MGMGDPPGGRASVAVLSCNAFVEVVTDYLEESCDGATMSSFEQHANACAGCRNYLDQMRMTIATLHLLAPHDLDLP
jgi:predicted anti-sigma-YlaC factor YlaD